jgi:hypothetical protein
MPKNGGRLGPTATTTTKGVFDVSEQYQFQRDGVWAPKPSLTGGTVTSDATYYYRMFTGSGTLTVSNGPVTADILVVAGGGGGGKALGGGGGAGGYQSFLSQSLGSGSYTVTVGSGGAGATSQNTTRGSSGGNSQFGALTASVGGGGGTGQSYLYPNGTGGASGGSGGGGARNNNAGGAGTPGQGNNGGSGSNSANAYAGGGGGGAGAVGGNGSGSAAGAGGVGLQWLNGAYYAGGGGAGSNGSGASAGGVGGGGNGSDDTGSYPPAGNGIANSGGGGGGLGAGDNSGLNGGAGGSGIVVLRYPKTAVQESTTIWATDEFAPYLKVALPLGTGLGIQDYSASISGSGTNRVVTPVNGSDIVSAQYKFYTGSLNNGTVSQDRYLSIPNSSDLAVTNNNFCIEGWFYFTATSIGYQCLASHSGDSADQQNGWIIITEANNPLYFYASENGGWDVGISSSTVPTTNTWHHIAVTRSSNTFRMFFNGTQIGTTTSSANITHPTSREMRIGSYRWVPGYPKSFNGYIQDFRMYIGTAKYTSNFTPPTAMYVGG